MSREEFASPPPLVGQAAAFLSAMEHASLAAGVDRPVLVVGERGSGKELVAARVHFLSKRWDQAFVKVNCAALAESLLESELFGHEAGAFTGAARRHVGRFERADGGTLFLDEIASASSRVQEQILRVIEYGEFERVGGSEPIRVDVRVVAAANIDLPSAAAEGRFRADLLDRLAFDVITVPPLRARREDIPILAEHFGRRVASERGATRFAGFDPGALAALLDHPWPGNVRELKNVVERAVYRALARDPSGASPIRAVVLDPFASPWRPPAGLSLPSAPTPLRDAGEAAEPEGQGPPPAPTPPSPSPLPGRAFVDQIAAVERALLREALAAVGGHQGRAAERLSLSYHQFRGLIRKHDIDARAVVKSPTAREPL